MIEKAPKHTIEKLTAYQFFLNNYLSVMTNQKHFKKIIICEPFAGSGDLKSGESGSARYSVDTINKFLEKQEDGNKIDIKLLLNDKNLKKFQELKEKFDNYHFVEILNLNAEDFLKKTYENWNSDYRGLFFIDPYGYTQVTQSTMRKILRLRIDVMLFLPTTHIYRFASENIEHKKPSPAIKFLNNLGIEYKNFNGLEELYGELTESFKKEADTEFGYYHEIKSKHSSGISKHCLFFTTHHIQGAIQIVGSIWKLRENNGWQSPLSEEQELKTMLKGFLAEKKDNCRLHTFIIEKCYLPKHVRPILEELEVAGEILVKQSLGRKERHKRSYYLNPNDLRITLESNNN